MTTEGTDWSNDPLHAALVQILPTYVRDPFADSPKLNVAGLTAALGRSREGVYKWLRTSRISIRGARAIIKVANHKKNVAALVKLGRKPPTIEDLAPFYLAIA
jgi:hypothetical protein